MKIQVNVKIPANKEEDTNLRLKVNEADSAAIVKERVASVQPMPFSEQELTFDGKFVPDSVRLIDFGVQDGASLDLVVKASEQMLLTQLTELLQARDLPCDELCLLYCYKYGASVSVALKAIGVQGRFEDFILQQKGFALESGRVALVRVDTKMKPFSVTDELVDILKASADGGMEIKELCNRFSDKFNVSLASLAGTRVSDFLSKQKGVLSVSGKVVSLPWQELSVPACLPPAQKPPSPQAAGFRPPPGLELPELPPMDVFAATVQPPATSYLELYDRIAPASLQPRLLGALGVLIDMVLDAAFVKIERVIKCGAIFTGTAISGCANADLVCVLPTLAAADFCDCVPAIARAMAGVLSARGEAADSELDFDDVTAVRDGVRIEINGPEDIVVTVRFSPAFDNHAAAVDHMFWEGVERRQQLGFAFANEKLQLMLKQATHVKMAIGILKRWRNKQAWTAPQSRPEDDLLEALAVYAAAQSQSTDVAATLASVLVSMRTFDSLCLLCNGSNAQSDVWPPLLEQRPLIMDLSNPFVNLAAAENFEPKQLMLLAMSADFLQ
eukprot:TRINITY_DN4006_c0_g2_i1.p1 TRINITY_DN4006_c0_g2~~TRINITY_DN4006_c0_g2_i1.p1  ORF type:complete len:558 (+),score=173.97 TRINITY_DN4006_c0_g2_i1:193-1866(+)